MNSPRHSSGPSSSRAGGIHSDRRGENLQPSQTSDPRGRSHSRASSSLTNNHLPTFSASGSHTTGTNESSAYNDVHRHPDDTQLLCVLDPSLEDPQPALSLTLNLATVQRQSTILFNHLNHDRINRVYDSTLSPERPLSSAAFRLFLEHIDRPPPPPGTRPYNEMAIDFPKFFELSIVLWTYICSIDQWLPIAQDIKNRDWQFDRDNRTPDRLVPWLFLGLLYDWPDVFEDASLELLSNCSKFQDEIDKAKFIPVDLLDAIQKQRQKYASDTYTFIRNKYVMLVDPSRSQQIPLVGTIHAVLWDKWDIDIRGDLPPDLYKFRSPAKLLRQVESTTSESHSQPSQIILPARRTGSPPRVRRDDDARSIQHELSRRAKGNRNSEAADALSLIVSVGLDKLKRKKKATTQSRPPPDQQMSRHELDEICDNLLRECREFREHTLRPLSLESFAMLRSRQLILSDT